MNFIDKIKIKRNPNIISFKPILYMALITTTIIIYVIIKFTPNCSTIVVKIDTISIIDNSLAILLFFLFKAAHK